MTDWQKWAKDIRDKMDEDAQKYPVRSDRVTGGMHSEFLAVRPEGPGSASVVRSHGGWSVRIDHGHTCEYRGPFWFRWWARYVAWLSNRK